MSASASIQVRKAERKDIPVILEFIQALADYEHMSDDVKATPELLNEFMFDKGQAKVKLALTPEGKAAGIAIYFYSFSTFLGRGGIYLEDLFVHEPYRGQGYGTALLQSLAQEAEDNKLGRLEWSCLDWNHPSIKYYLSLKAKPQSEWTMYRLTGQALTDLAKRK